MRDALHDAGNGEIVYYLDAGNPTNVMKLFNPKVRKAPRVSFESLIQNLETTVYQDRLGTNKPKIQANGCLAHAAPSCAES